MGKCSGCGGAAARARASRQTVPGYSAAVNANGMTVLASWLDCTEPYNGTSQREDVFIVGLGTDVERIFTIDQGPDAVAYTKQTRTKLTRVTAHTLCHGAMVELFGS
jgi:hypothetical protein